MFNQRWINLCILMVLIGVVFHAPAMAVLPVFLLLTVLAGTWWNNRALNDLVYQRRILRRRAFPGELVEVDLLVENNKLLPVPWLRVVDEWPLAAPPSDRDVLGPSRQQDMGSLTNVFALRWYERVRRRYVLHAQRRGVFGLGPTRLVSGDVFGLFQAERVIEEQDFLVVYPRVYSLPELGLPSKEPFGDTRARRQLFEDPSRTMGARDLRPGDSFRHVHWPATARRQQLQTRVYEPTTTLTTMLCLNVATLPRPWEGILEDLLERTISVAASLAAYAADQRYSIGLIANGAVPRSDRSIRIRPGRSPDQLAHILEMLAAITGYVTVPMGKFLLRESPGIPWGATFIIVTPIVTEELLAAIDQLRIAGRQMVLVALTENPPPLLSGVLTHHLPYNIARPPKPDEPLIQPNVFSQWREARS
jgi:uncharacterized protein (DUF58 family)